MFHVPSLKGLMTDNQHFRPKLRLREDLLTISIDIADLSSLPGAEMAVVQVCGLRDDSEGQASPSGRVTWQRFGCGVRGGGRHSRQAGRRLLTIGKLWGSPSDSQLRVHMNAPALLRGQRNGL